MFRQALALAFTTGTDGRYGSRPLEVNPRGALSYYTPLARTAGDLFVFTDRPRHAWVYASDARPLSAARQPGPWDRRRACIASRRRTPAAHRRPGGSPATDRARERSLAERTDALATHDPPLTTDNSPPTTVAYFVLIF